MTEPSTDGAWLEAEDGARTALSGNCALGRSNSNHIVVKAESASRQHATIHAQDEGEYWLIDLGSSNGTYLNDFRVSRPTRLQSGDRIRIAGLTWVFRQEARVEADGDDSSAEVTLVTSGQISQIECWLLLADIEGFTPLSRELSPHALAELVGGWVKAGRRIVEANAGSLNKYLGDGFLAVWREGEGVADKVAEAIRAFQEVQKARQPPFRVVLHRGLVATGGAASHGEESLAGLQVNFTFRLEKLAAGLKVACAASERAAAALGERLPLAPVDGEHELKGIVGKHRLHAILPDATVPA